jgi:hypothetical protein
VARGVPKHGPRPPAHTGPAKGGKGPPHGSKSYSWDDYKRDLDKANKEQRDGLLEELPADLEVLGGALEGGGMGALGATIKNAPKLIKGKAQEAKGEWDALSATGKFLGARINEAEKSNQHQANPKTQAQKSNQRPKAKSGSNR